MLELGTEESFTHLQPLFHDLLRQESLSQPGLESPRVLWIHIVAILVQHTAKHTVAERQTRLRIGHTAGTTMPHIFERRFLAQSCFNCIMAAAQRCLFAELKIGWGPRRLLL